jgi:hypothetical protein
MNRPRSRLGRWLWDHALLWPLLALFLLGEGLHAFAVFVMTGDESNKAQDFVEDTGANMSWAIFEVAVIFVLAKFLPFRGSPEAKDPEEVEAEHDHKGGGE